MNLAIDILSITLIGGETMTNAARLACIAGMLLITTDARTSSAQAVEGRLFTWQENGFTTPSPAGDNFTAIAAGGTYNIALRSDGSLAAWGDDQEFFPELATVPAGNDFIAVAAGGLNGLALRSDGSLVAWGVNLFGETDAPAGNDFIAISASTVSMDEGVNLALRSDGSIVGWGYNSGASIPPGQVPGQLDEIPLGNNFVAIDAGGYHSLALKSDGSLVGWGDGLGQATAPAGNDFVAISAGLDHSLALRSDGSLVAWGSNNSGQTNAPAGNDFVAIAAGAGHSLALKTDGSIVAWGRRFLNFDFDLSGNDFMAISSSFGEIVAIRSPLPGSSQGNPIFPDGTQPPDGFTVDENGVVRDRDGNVIVDLPNFPPTQTDPPVQLSGGSARWFDPPVTFGYVFEMVSDSLFTDILDFPTGFEGDFEVWVNGTSLGLYGAGDHVDFIEHTAAGVSSFAITGITPLVDGSDPLAFPIQLAFDTEFATFTMTPLSIVPEPSSIIAVAVLAGLGSIRRRRGTRHCAARKQCAR